MGGEDIARMSQCTDFEIRPLGASDAATYQALRLRGLRDTPEAFGSTYEEDVVLTLETIADRIAHVSTSPARVVFGAWQDGTLIGVVGAFQSPKRKTRHIATVWGTYVAPEARGRGVGRQLMTTLITEVRHWPDVARVTLSVVERAAAAWRLYSALGFTEFGREADAYRGDGVSDTAIHLALVLDEAASRIVE